MWALWIRCSHSTEWTRSRPTVVRISPHPPGNTWCPLVWWAHKVPRSLSPPWIGTPGRQAPPAAVDRRTGGTGRSGEGVGLVGPWLGEGSLGRVQREKTRRLGCWVRMCSGRRRSPRLRGRGKPRSAVAPATENRIYSSGLHIPAVHARTGTDTGGWPAPAPCIQAHTWSRGRT